jgi:dihydroneopterin aldolase
LLAEALKGTREPIAKGVPRLPPVDADSPNGSRSIRPRQPAQLDKIFVRDLVLSCSIGAFAEEKTKKQRVRFQVEVWIYPSRRRGNDDVNGVVSYDLIVEAIHSVTRAGHINLLETLADRVAAKCLAHRRAAKVHLVVEKLDRLEGASLGVEIERLKSPAA